MDFLDEAHLGFHRIEALVDFASVRDCLLSSDPQRRDLTVAWLAFLGWTPKAFLVEALPEEWEA